MNKNNNDKSTYDITDKNNINHKNFATKTNN